MNTREQYSRALIQELEIRKKTGWTHEQRIAFHKRAATELMRSHSTRLNERPFHRTVES